MRLTPELYGRFHPRGAAELRVEIASPRAISAELTLNDLNGSTRRLLQLDEQRKQTLWMPTRPRTDGTIDLVLVPQEQPAINRTVRFTPTTDPITLVAIDPQRHVWNQAQTAQPETSTILLISANSFPHTLSGYDPVQSVITDLPTLSALDERQSKALGGYLAACGILLLDIAPSAIIARLAGSAGCAGRFIQRFDKIDDVSALLARLTSQQPPKLPDVAELQRLEPTPGGTSLVIYLSVYLLTMLLLTIWLRRPVLLLIFPLLAGTAGLLIWSGEGNQQLIVWAETESGDANARYAALLSIGGDRRGLQQIRWRLGRKLTRDIDDPKTAPPIQLDASKGEAHVSSTTTLFSPVFLKLAGLLPRPPSYALKLKLKDGEPMLSNAGLQPSPPGQLVWRNRSYPVPALNPTETWQPGAAAAQLEHPALALLRRRLTYGSTALLYPLSPDPASIAPSATRINGWLVIHPTQGPGR